MRKKKNKIAKCKGRKKILFKEKVVAAQQVGKKNIKPMTTAAIQRLHKMP